MRVFCHVRPAKGFKGKESVKLINGESKIETIGKASVGKKKNTRQRGEKPKREEARKALRVLLDIIPNK